MRSVGKGDEADVIDLRTKAQESSNFVVIFLKCVGLLSLPLSDIRILSDPFRSKKYIKMRIENSW